jgi:uncharacterized protein (TIGR02147 family)
MRADVKEAIKQIVVLEFLDYRDYLRALYRHLKATQKSYSYAAFTRDLGLGEGNMSYLILKKNRNIRKASALKIVRALGLGGVERKYFWMLVQHNQATDAEKRDGLFAVLLKLKQRALKTEESRRELEFFREWYHAVVFEMLALSHLDPDPARMASKVMVPVTKEQVARSLELLEEIGCISKDSETGRFKRNIQDFSAGDDVIGMGIASYHHRMIDMAKESITRIPHWEREISSVTLAVSEDRFVQIKQMVRQFQEFLMFVAGQPADKTRVVQVNFQIFPLTQNEEAP